MLPYPSSLFTTADSDTDTGRRINYPLLAMPANNSGTHIDPTAWNTLDGYSPGTMILANFPQGVDVVASNLPPLTDFTASLAATSPTILLDYDSGERIEHFAEVDASVDVAPPKQALIIRPGRRLKNNGHYIVALRGLIPITLRAVIMTRTRHARAALPLLSMCPVR